VAGLGYRPAPQPHASPEQAAVMLHLDELEGHATGDLPDLFANGPGDLPSQEVPG